MPETPTPHELARDIRQLEEARREDMMLLRREIRDLGDRLERRFDGLTAVSYDAFVADQARQDDQIGHLRGDVHQLRKWVIGGFLAVIAAGILLPLLTAV